MVVILIVLSLPSYSCDAASHAELTSRWTSTLYAHTNIPRYIQDCPRDPDPIMKSVNATDLLPDTAI